MKLLKSIRMTVALILTLTMIALVPLNTVAAANNGKYVSEVYVAYGKDAEEAKKTLSDKGFTPVEGNLNDGGKTYAMMGFKITRDIRESITDLAVMNMRGDYSVYVFYKTDNTVLPAGEPDAEETSSAFNAGTAAIFGFGGLIIGGALGAVIVVMINKNKKKKETV